MIPTNEPPTVILTPEVNDREIKNSRHARLFNSMVYGAPGQVSAPGGRSDVGPRTHDLLGVNPYESVCAIGGGKAHLG